MLLRTLNWIGTIIQVPMSLLTIVTTIYLCVSIMRYSKSIAQESARKRLISTSILSNLSYSIASVLSCIQCFCELLSIDARDAVLGKIAISVHMLSQTIMISVFIIRVESTFRGSVMEYGQCAIRLLYLSSVCLLFFYFFLITLLTLSMYKLALMLAFLWMTLYLTMSIILVCLFMRKLELMMTNTAVNKRRESELPSPSVQIDSATTDSTQSEPNLVSDTSTIKKMIDAKFLFVVTKHSVLVPIAVCASFVFMTLGFGTAFVVDRDSFVPLAAMWTSFDCAIVSICNCLLFGSNQWLYSALCSRCHLRCERFKLGNMKRKVNRRLSAEINISRMQSGEQQDVARENQTNESEQTSTANENV